MGAGLGEQRRLVLIGAIRHRSKRRLGLAFLALDGRKSATGWTADNHLALDRFRLGIKIRLV